jgi:FKBP-type peptidyl-prolyl cis-trans isomerase 2
MKFIWKGPQGGADGNHALCGKQIGETVELSAKLAAKVRRLHGEESLEAVSKAKPTSKADGKPEAPAKTAPKAAK